jgi:hypothetical protein
MARNQGDGEAGLDRYHQGRDHQVAVPARHRPGALPRRRRWPRHSRRQQEGERAGAADECGPTSPSPPRPECRAPAHAGLRGDDPEADLADLAATALLVALGQLLGDDRARIGSKLVFSFCGSEATCCAT